MFIIRYCSPSSWGKSKKSIIYKKKSCDVGDNDDDDESSTDSMNKPLRSSFNRRIQKPHSDRQKRLPLCERNTDNAAAAGHLRVTNTHEKVGAPLNNQNRPRKTMDEIENRDPGQLMNHQMQRVSVPSQLEFHQQSNTNGHHTITPQSADRYRKTCSQRFEEGRRNQLVSRGLMNPLNSNVNPYNSHVERHLILPPTPSPKEEVIIPIVTTGGGGGGGDNRAYTANAPVRFLSQSNARHGAMIGSNPRSPQPNHEGRVVIPNDSPTSTVSSVTCNIPSDSGDKKADSGPNLLLPTFSADLNARKLWTGESNTSASNLGKFGFNFEFQDDDDDDILQSSTPNIEAFTNFPTSNNVIRRSPYSQIT